VTFAFLIGPCNL